MLKKSVFIFRRDLRLQDNSGLIAAMEASESVIPVFIIDPALLARWSSAVARLAFLTASLQKLDEELKTYNSRLTVLHGDPVEVVAGLIEKSGVDAVFINRDYTPIALRRDAKLAELCAGHEINFYKYGDQLLNEPESVAKADGLPYTVFTPFFRKARDLQVSAPVAFSYSNFAKADSSKDLHSSPLASYIDPTRESRDGGAASLLAQLEILDNYDESKDIPGVTGTTRLSAYLRFGLVSARQVYQAVLDAHSLAHGVIKQLYWRDFYFHIGYHFPHVYRSAFRKKYRNLAWDDNPSGFQKWQNGKTGFPIVDAGMRELMSTGFMHNRVRMITASFLTKNLHINWQLGEAHFARYLIDYDPALNNGNWQWSASTGCDAQPYFRVFNPWRQQKRFDPECRYIKQWIPELGSLEPKEIHGLEKIEDAYLPQIVDLKFSAEESKARFKALASQQPI